MISDKTIELISGSPDGLSREGISAQPEDTVPEHSLTVAEFAQLHRVSPRTVWNWIAEGRIHVVKLAPRVTRILASEAEDFVARCMGEKHTQ